MDNRAKEQAAAQYSSIVRMLSAVGCDYSRLEDMREESKRPRFAAGWNMPGYMPDSDPQEFDDEDEALEYIKDGAKGALEIDTVSPGMTDEQAQDAEDEIEGWITDKNGEFGATIRGLHYFITRDGFMPLNESDAEELEELEAAAGDCEDEDDARQRISEDPLSVEVRSGWASPGEPLEASEFCILLCTGGPAVRIRGELDRGEPSRAWLEFQDWGTPWQQYFDASSDTLCEYASHFFFGE
jgi:hypothetical protein